MCIHTHTHTYLFIYILLKKKREYTHLYTHLLCAVRCAMGKWRGKRVNIYFGDEEILKKLNEEPNKSELINSLLKDYYNKDLEFLEQQKQQLIQQQTIIQMKIDNLLETREKIKKLKNNEKQKAQEVQEHKNLINEIMSLWKNKKISEDEYWSLFKDGKLIKSKAEKYVNI